MRPSSCLPGFHVRPLLGLGLCLLALAAPMARAQDAGEGQALYMKYCATCHGAEATGGGPMAPVLLLQPPDLTALARNNGNRFPVARVAERIDGRDPLVSHGSPMPIYGPIFEDVQSVAIKEDSGQPVMMSQRVADVVAYLRAIQR